MAPAPLMFKKKKSPSQSSGSYRQSEDTASIHSNRSSKSSLHGVISADPGLSVAPGLSSASTSSASSPSLLPSASASPHNNGNNLSDRLHPNEMTHTEGPGPGPSSLGNRFPTTALQVEVETKPVFLHSPSITSLKKYAEQETHNTTPSIPIPSLSPSQSRQDTHYKHKCSPEHLDYQDDHKKQRPRGNSANEETRSEAEPQSRIHTEAFYNQQALSAGNTSGSIRSSLSYWNLWGWGSPAIQADQKQDANMEATAEATSGDSHSKVITNVNTSSNDSNINDKTITKNVPSEVPCPQQSKDVKTDPVNDQSSTSSWSRFFSLSASRPAQTSSATPSSQSQAPDSLSPNTNKHPSTSLEREAFIKSPPPSPTLNSAANSKGNSPSPPDFELNGQKLSNAAKSSQGGARSWAFWARSADKESEFAVSGTSTQNSPYKAKTQTDPLDTSTDANTSVDSAAVSSSATVTNSSKKPKRRIPNIVTPTHDMCFPVYSSTQMLKSSLSKLSEYILPAKPEKSAMTTIHGHLYRTSPAKVSKVVVIGVHGYFPAKVIRPLIGEPTGTSIKFANEAAKAVERWANEKGCIIEVEKIALEGEGKVLHRVETLYKLLCNWLHLIYEADFVYFAAHSQGTPVAVHLLARLVEEGHVESKKVALLGMAGISLGPIYGLDQKLLMRAISSLENDSLKELFEFQNPASYQSRKYVESLRTIIAHNAKIVFVGSLNDQLVPLYSSTCAHISHPNIFRSVFIDSSNVSSEFIPTLIGIALRLRNIGSTDHGLVKEISGALPGALTSGGHSRLYDEPRVYDLLVRQALETSNEYQNTPVKVSFEFEIPKTNHNPYLLPWSMRGLINEARLRPEFSEQLDELFSEFSQWKPEAKSFKDLKYRLGAIKANL